MPPGTVIGQIKGKYHTTCYFCGLKLLRFENLDKSFNCCELNLWVSTCVQITVCTCVCVGTVTAWESKDRPKYLRILFVHSVISLQNSQKYHDCRNNPLYGMGCDFAQDGLCRLFLCKCMQKKCTVAVVSNRQMLIDFIKI